MSVTFSSCFSVSDQRPLVLDEHETLCTLFPSPIGANGTKRMFSRGLFFLSPHLLPAVSCLLDCCHLQLKPRLKDVACLNSPIG